MWLKNLIDKIAGIILLILLSPLLLIIGILIKFEDKGKIFYLQKRLGKDGEIFDIYKFRTMKENAPDIRLEDGSTFNSDDDPRVTKIGKILRKTSLDELSQIINVLKGE
ncbi:MAG: sugar transferase, partial [Cetobacterium sp.]